MIAISSGALKGVKLSLTHGNQTRPSSDRLRQATFNVLRHFNFEDHGILEDAVVADLFAGTGAWGIEALSNGVSHLICVESHAMTLKTLKRNLTHGVQCLKNQNIEVKVEVFAEEVESTYKNLPECSVIFADPPYEQGFFEKVIACEVQTPRLKKGGVFLYEAFFKEKLLTSKCEQLLEQAGLKILQEKIYGESVVLFFIKG